MRIAQLIAASLIGLAAPAAAEDRALIIGIGAYDHLPALPGAVQDARAMAALATQTLGFAADHVTVLIDADASRARILRAVEDELLAGTGPGDRVLVYFAGHGAQLEDEGGDESADGLDEVFVLGAAAGPDPAAVIRDDELADMLDRLADRRVTVVADTCYAGASAAVARAAQGVAQARCVPWAAATRSAASVEDRRRDSGLADRLGAGRDHAIWSATAATQTAWEVEAGGRTGGLFTQGFIAAMAGAADANGNGRVSREETLAALRTRSGAFCHASGVCEAGLTPVLTAPPASRALSVVAWPEDEGPEGGAADTPPGSTPGPTPGPGAAPGRCDDIPGRDRRDLSIDDVLDVIAGGTKDVRIRLLPEDPAASGPVQGGDAVVFEITSPREGDLLLFDIRDCGVVHQLFPSTAIPKRTPLSPNAPLRLPDAYHATRFTIPPGEGALVVLVAHDDRIVDRLARENAQMRPIPEPNDFFGSLMGELNGTKLTRSGVRAVSFGQAVLRYDAE